MSTGTEPKAHQDVWQQVPASWAAYQSLLRERGERGRPKYIYVDRRLTIVSPGTPHEVLKKRVGGLIETLCLALRIPYLAFGESTYLKFRKGRAGTEPDESYYLTNLGRMMGAERVVIGRDPAPDLMIEVVFSHPATDSLEVYRRFGVREVWVCDRTEVVFHVLGDDGHYAAVPVSACFPFLPSADLGPWVDPEEREDDMGQRLRFFAWAQETLGPRRPGL